MFTMATAGRLLTDWAGDPGAVLEYGVRFSSMVPVPDDDTGTTLTVSGKVEDKLDGKRVRCPSPPAAARRRSCPRRARSSSSPDRLVRGPSFAAAAAAGAMVAALGLTALAAVQQWRHPVAERAGDVREPLPLGSVRCSADQPSRLSRPARRATFRPIPSGPRCRLTFSGRRRPTAPSPVTRRVVFTPDQPVTELVFRLWPNGQRPPRRRLADRVQGAARRPTPVTARRLGTAGAQARRARCFRCRSATPRRRASRSSPTWTSPWSAACLHRPGGFRWRRPPGGARGAPVAGVGTRRCGWVRTPAVHTLAEMSVAEAARHRRHGHRARRRTRSWPTAWPSEAGRVSPTPAQLALHQPDGARRAGRGRSLAGGHGERRHPGRRRVPVTVAPAAPGWQVLPTRRCRRFQRALPLLVKHSARTRSPSLRSPACRGCSAAASNTRACSCSARTPTSPSSPTRCAHMWFYGMVGDDQSLHPWLDEAFATAARSSIDVELFNGTLAAAPRTTGRRWPPQPVRFAGVGLRRNLVPTTSRLREGRRALVQARMRSGPPAFDAALRCYVNANAWTGGRPRGGGHAPSRSCRRHWPFSARPAPSTDRADQVPGGSG